MICVYVFQWKNTCIKYSCQKEKKEIELESDQAPGSSHKIYNKSRGKRTCYLTEIQLAKYRLWETLQDK